MGLFQVGVRCGGSGSGSVDCFRWFCRFGTSSGLVLGGSACASDTAGCGMLGLKDILPHLIALEDLLYFLPSC